MTRLIKQLYWDGKEISRYMLHQPITDSLCYKCILTMRDYQQYPHPRYYIYSEDEETLIMAADIDRSAGKFTISMDANEISTKSKSYLGILERSINGKFFISYSWHMYKDDSKREIIQMKKESKSLYQVSIPKIGTLRLQSPKEKRKQNPPNSIELVVEEETEGLKQFKSEYQNKTCFLLRQTDEDEYLLNISYPLSVYQSFIVALAIIK